NAIFKLATSHDIIHHHTAQEPAWQHVLDGQAQEQFVQQPDKGMWRDLVLGPLRDDDQRVAALRIAYGELEEHHGGIYMPHEVDTGKAQAIEHPPQFFGAFGQANRACSTLLPPIEDDAARFAEGADLAGIHKFQVFQNRHKHERFALSNVDKGQIERANLDT